MLLFPGLGEALASYQPTSRTPAAWARFRDDAVALVAKLDRLELSRDTRTSAGLASQLSEAVTHTPPSCGLTSQQGGSRSDARTKTPLDGDTAPLALFANTPSIMGTCPSRTNTS